MIYWRCKCGEHQLWESGMSPSACVVCKKCGSTLATGPNIHRDPQPHELSDPVLEVRRNVCYRVVRCARCRVELSSEEVAR